MTDATCPFGGDDGLDLLFETVLARQFYHRALGQYDAANVWANYEHALLCGYMSAYEFDFDKADRLAMLGGWTHTRATP
jgi:hypothetical protein